MSRIEKMIKTLNGDEKGLIIIDTKNSNVFMRYVESTEAIASSILLLTDYYEEGQKAGISEEKIMTSILCSIFDTLTNAEDRENTKKLADITAQMFMKIKEKK